MIRQEFKYENILNWIRKNIEEGVIRHDAKLPSENALCLKFGTSRQTVRKALDRLEEEGAVRKVRGSGTYVVKNAAETRKKTIGVLTSYVNDYIFPSIIQGIEAALHHEGYGMELGISNNRIEKERIFLERVLDENISGLLIEGTKTGLPNPNIVLYKKLMEARVPIVFMHNYYREIDCPKVILDDAGYSQKLTELLIDAGHRNITGFFKFDDMQGQKRYEGYVKALYEAKIPIREEFVGWYSDRTESDVFEHFKFPLLNILDHCTAIVCYNDQLASKVCSFFKSNGIRVPEDISMVGFDDSFSDSFNLLELTTIKHPKRKLGEAAVQLLMNMINNGIESVSARPMYIDAEIVVRKSIKDLREIENVGI